MNSASALNRHGGRRTAAAMTPSNSALPNVTIHTVEMKGGGANG